MFDRTRRKKSHIRVNTICVVDHGKCKNNSESESGSQKFADSTSINQIENNCNEITDNKKAKPPHFIKENEENKKILYSTCQLSPALEFLGCIGAEDRLVFDDSDRILGIASLSIEKDDDNYMEKFRVLFWSMLDLIPDTEIHQNNIVMSLFKPWLALCAPPEKKLLTYPVSEPTKIYRQQLSFLSLFWNKDDDLSGNKHNEPGYQEDCHKRFGQD